MKLTKVSYTRLATLPGYNNETVHAEALIEDGETAEQAFVAVKAWVLERVGKAYERSNQEQMIQELQYQKSAMENAIVQLQRRREFLRNVLKKHDVIVPELEEDEDSVPF